MRTNLLIKSLLIIILLTFSMPSMAVAADPVKTVTENSDERAAQLLRRLEEIKEMDTKKLSKSEKKMLRVEVRAIKKEMAAISGGVYLSVGALLLVILLLIILL